MPEPTATPSPEPPPAVPKTQPRGYFNKAQVEDIGIADGIQVAASAADRQTDLATKDIPADYIAGLGTLIAQAQKKMAATGQAQSGHQPAGLTAGEAERTLITTLQAIQSAAKQRERMEQEDEDPATNFTATGYLLGQRLNQNRAALLQNAATLFAKATADRLPGYRTPAALQSIETAIATYRQASASQAEAEEDAEQDRIQRDALVRKINSRRMAIQHAIDGLYPYLDESHHPIRRRFHLPTDRPFNG